MNYFMCFNHKYPLCMIEEETVFKKFLGRVRKAVVVCHCPECHMEITYSIKIEGYKNLRNREE